MRAWRRTSRTAPLVAPVPVVIEILQFADVVRVTFDRDLVTEAGEPALWVLTPLAVILEAAYGAPPGTRVLLSVEDPVAFTQLEFAGGPGVPGTPTGLAGGAVAAFTLPVPFPT